LLRRDLTITIVIAKLQAVIFWSEEVGRVCVLRSFALTLSKILNFKPIQMTRHEEEADL
jgi:hypothetical protein